MKGEEFTAAQLVSEGLCDPVSVFVKNEPHPARKVDRLRVVNALSIVDQLVERFIFSDMLRAFHDNYPNSGVMCGVGFTDRQARELCHLYLGLIENAPANYSPFSEDVSGWERTLSVERMEQAFRQANSRASGPDVWRRVMIFWHIRLTNPVYVLPEHRGYSFWYCTVPGRMLSGSFLTTIMNGVARLNSMYETGAITPFVNGDDGISLRDVDEVDASIELAKEFLGINLRDVIRHDETGFSFCSHWFDCERGVAWLESWPKALFRLLTRTSDQSLYEDFSREVVNMPEPLKSKVLDVAYRFRHLAPQISPQALAEGK